MAVQARHRRNPVATDKLIHKLATTHPAAILKLFKIPDCDDYQASSFTFKEIENRRDIIFEKMTGGEAILLETQGYDDVYFYHRTIIGKMMYHVQKKFTGMLRTVVIFLEESHYHAALKLAHHFDGSSELAFQPTVFIFGQKDVSELENLDDVRLVPLYPLCKISRNEIKSRAPEWAERIKRTASISEKERRDLLALLGGFIVHRIRNLTLAKINQLFGDFKMEDTLVGKELIEIGVLKGREEGRKQGRKEGRKEGRKLGSLQTMREMITDLINSKLGRVERNWRTQLNMINQISTLKALYHAVLHAKSGKQVQTAFDSVFGNGKKTK
jgi:predicted transposase YdaD